MSFTEKSPVISWAREADRMAFVYYDDGKWTVWAVDNPRTLRKQPFRVQSAVVASLPGTSARRAGRGRCDRQRPPHRRARRRRTQHDVRLRRPAPVGVSPRRRPARCRGRAGGRARRRRGVAISVAALLDSAAFALPDPSTFKDKKYDATLRAEYVERPQVTYAQNNFGRGVFGGTTIVLADMLGNHQLALSAAVNGRIDEAQVFVGFQSLANRFQYATGFQQAPIFLLQSQTQSNDTSSYALSRFIVREGFFNGSYPLNRFARVELGGSLYSIERATQYLSASAMTGFAYYVDSVANRSTLNFINPFVAYVSDNTLFGMTGPIFGRRMRFEAGPTLGGAQWMHVAADYRRYDPIVFNYLTFATRAQVDLSMGRDEMEFPKYIGQPFYVRGYDHSTYGSLGGCGSLAGTGGSCSATELLGSRFALANVELRFPIVRSAYFGLLPFAFPPIEGLFFYDIGAAWKGGQSLSLTRPDNYDYTKQRYFLSSHGFGIRVNVFNIAIIRWDYAIPHDGASRKGYWVWTLGSSY